MASSRMDLEARLRALRAPKGGNSSSANSLPSTSPSTASPAPAVPVLPIAPVDVIAWPEAPVAAGLPWPDPPTVKPRRSSSGVLGEVMVIPRRSSVNTQSSSNRSFQPPQPQSQQQLAQQSNQLPEPAVEAASGVSVASLLGPAYSEAVQIAQQAIESERNRHAHTAIDLYIRAGQQLISIGRQQHTAHLQTIVRKKALALLERAEGLSDWVSSVQAVDSSEEAMDAAFAGAQREREQALTEKEALVAKMRSENSEMSQKLNQLVLLTKVRARFRRMVSDRRARKAEEALRSASLEDNNSNNNTNDVEGEDEPQEDEHEAQERRSSFSSSTSSRSSLSGHITNQTPEEREAQKRDLVNELHSRIGLPEISTLRKFTPLSSDAMKDIRHVELEDELETARLEAERLRAAVQEMEECFQATLEQTRQQSLKITQEKEQNLAQMEDELLRVRSELERERRLTASSFGGSNRSNQSTNDRDGEGDDLDSYEDVAMIRSLRSSLHLLGQNPATAASQDSKSKKDEQPGGERTAPTMKRGWSTSESEDDSDVDEDGVSESDFGRNRFVSPIRCCLWAHSRLKRPLMDNYAKIKLLGEGSFGRVFLMREKQPGGRLVCVKEIHSIHSSKASKSNSSAPVMEIQLMKKLNHPNLIRFLASFRKTSSDTEKNGSREKSSKKSCIVMEFCSGGDLRAYLNKHRGNRLHSQPQQLTEDLIWFWFLQLCLGLHHMHQLQVLHRDVKTSNVFLSNAGFLVLGDFGIARELSGPHDMASTVIGTPLYMAPETLEGKPYSFASDIWALGCVLYELCTGDPPFMAKSTPALIHKICESKFAPLSRTRFSSKLQDLVTKMLSVDVKNRPTAVSILKDPGMHAHLKRYFHDRFMLSSSGISNKIKQQEEQTVLSKQLQMLGVTVNVNPTSNVAIDTNQTNQGHGVGGDANVKSSDKEISEAKLMAEREHERQQQLLVALDKLQRLRLQEGLAGASDNKDDLNVHVPQDKYNGGEAAALQRPDPVFPQFRRASGSDESEIRWKDPVQDRPRSRSGRDHEKPWRSITNSHSASASTVLSSFLGIPRKGVPLTTQAKEFASHSPVCKDVRVLRKQERAKAADMYKQRLAAIKPLRAAQPPPVAAGAQRPHPSRVQQPMVEEQTDDAILHSIQELQEALGANPR